MATGDRVVEADYVRLVGSIKTNMDAPEVAWET